GTGLPDHDYVALLDLYFLSLALGLQQPLIVVVYGDRHYFFGAVLSNNIGVQEFLYFQRLFQGQFGRQVLIFSLLGFFGDYTMGLLYTTITYVGIQARDQ